MYVKTIILDGFKSYGSRTEIGPFDSEFTAITGLNGTGKSNILDSICFVLGITNLTQVIVIKCFPLLYIPIFMALRSLVNRFAQQIYKNWCTKTVKLVLRRQR